LPANAEAAAPSYCDLFFKHDPVASSLGKGFPCMGYSFANLLLILAVGWLIGNFAYAAG